jgi:hypothetical protein
MINVKQIINDYVWQHTTAIVEVYEITSGIKRVKDTFEIKFDNLIHEERNTELDEMILAKLAEIGYIIDMGQQADGTPKTVITDNTANWVAPSDPAVNPITDPNIFPKDVIPTYEEAMAVAGADPNLVGNQPVN